jgi:hypothetical protein
MTEEVKPATAIASLADEMRLMNSVSAIFIKATTAAELDAAWAKHVSPIYNQLEEETTGILHKLYALKQTVLHNQY